MSLAASAKVGGSQGRRFILAMVTPKGAHEVDRLIPAHKSVFADSGFADPDLTRGRFAATGLVPFLLRVLGWGCSHDNYTLPMRLPGATELTVSCLQCGARLRYDWQRMALADGRPPSSQATRPHLTVTNDRAMFAPAPQSSDMTEAA